jgi:hypothetical protein
MMHQSARHNLLSSLGIRSWYCKYTLPNAALTPAKIFSKVKAIESVSVRAAYLDDVLSTKLILTNPKLAIQSKHDVDIEFNSDKPVVLKEVLSDGSCLEEITPLEINYVPELTLSVAFFDKVIILYEKSVSGDSALEELLLENIISVLKGKKTENSSPNSILSWPVFKSKALFNEQSVYFGSVAKRWLGAQCWSECVHLLYFGDSFSAIESVLLGIRDEQCLSYSVAPFKESLTQIVGSPIKKKNIWEQFSNLGIISG